MNDGFLLAMALRDAARRNALEDGLDTVVRCYYAEYAGADSIEPQYLAAMRLVFGLGPMDEYDVDEVIRETEQAINAEGGTRGEGEEKAHPVHTVLEYLDEEE